MLKKEIAVLCTALVFGSTIAAWANHCEVATAEQSTGGSGCSTYINWRNEQKAQCTQETYTAGYCGGTGGSKACTETTYQRALSNYRPVNANNCDNGCEEFGQRRDVAAVRASASDIACHQP